MASQDASARGKRPPTDPRGPVLELLSAFKIGGRNGYYDDKVRGKVLRMDNLLASSGTARDGAKAKARPSYGGGRHRRAAAADGEDGSDAVDSWKTLKYEDFQPLRDLWNAYFDDLVRPAGKNLTDDMLAEEPNMLVMTSSSVRFYIHRASEGSGSQCLLEAGLFALADGHSMESAFSGQQQFLGAGRDMNTTAMVTRALNELVIVLSWTPQRHFAEDTSARRSTLSC
eukprot:TRINITY_DN46625_c0_g1_i2.p1 TRINITY_DN46625_c0_g1~~TRINITY_DN46625_c0_g1_i2.p1  ORF type:complete len:228 (-),score=37.62 TRINITY_DN46625_c0_g1_i2:213-896(-)